MVSSSSTKRVAIIPARGGSKRIPRKNIRSFCGSPAIAYAINAAKASGLFDDIVVSTDDDGIAEVSRALGASVPFKRTRETSDDFSTTAAVLREVLQALEKNGQIFNECCCIYETAVFVTPSQLQQAHQLLIQGGFDQTFPVVAYPSPIERAFRLDDQNRVYSAFPEHINTRTQDLQTAFHDAGQFYWIKTRGFCERDTLFTDNAGVIICPEMSVHDIDTEADWIIAEEKYRLSVSAA